ncbi:hypothetical protein AB0875_12440 [Micromonospora gifhornensis]|uniref:hypothetical protein n=1 Tax=Micromonospora gifhornensis TaxID=84594 RepID=UPI0034528741
MSTLHRVLGAHAAGTAVFVALGEAAVALPPGPTDVRAALAALTIPVLAAGGSLLAIAVAEGRKQQQAEVPVQQRRAVAASRRRELMR